MQITTSGEAEDVAEPSATRRQAEADQVERARVEAVRRYDVLDSPPDGAFDKITQLAAKLFNVPISIVSIVDTDRIWFKSHHGVDAEETSRDPGLCASAVLQDDVYVVTDAQMDPRTLANPLVAGSLGLQFYAGKPLVTGDGHRLGTLCVIDRAPREVTDDELETLRTLGDVVMDELELRLSARRVLALETETSAHRRSNIRPHGADRRDGPGRSGEQPADREGVGPDDGPLPPQRLRGLRQAEEEFARPEHQAQGHRR